MFRRILLAVDGSSTSNAAIREASPSSWPGTSEVRLRVVHVINSLIDSL